MMGSQLRAILLVFFLLTITPLGAQVPGFFMKKESRREVIPFSKANNLIIIPVAINGGPPVNFLFDTGVKSNILFSKTIGDELGLTYSRKLNLIGADGKTVLTASVSSNNHFDLGPVEGIMQAILVLDEDFLELEKVIGVPVYGVIGYEFFKYNPIKIDYDTSRLIFYRPTAFKWKPFGYRELEIQINDNKPYVLSRIRQMQGPDLEAKLLVDTGANHSLLLNQETSKDIVLPPAIVETELGRSLGGDLFGYMGRVKRLDLGGITFRDVLTSYPDATEFSNIILGTGRLGSLGSELLSRLKLIVDFPKERILMKKGSDFGSPFAYDMSGISVRLISVEEGSVYVSQVRKDSPAFNQGVKQFDEIVSINKVPVEFWRISDIIELLRSEEGRTITLELLRSSQDKVEELTISFVLKKQL